MKTSQELFSQIIDVALRQPGWGCKRIAHYLSLDGVSVSSPTVQKLLIEAKLGRHEQRVAKAQISCPDPTETHDNHPCGNGNVVACNVCAAFEQSKWKDLKAGELNEFGSIASSFPILNGESVYHQGDDCRGLYCVKSGVIAMRTYDIEGNSMLVRLAKAGDTIGHRTFFEGGSYPDSAEALSDSAVCFLDKRRVERLLRSNPRLTTLFLQQLAMDLGQLQETLIYTSSQSVRTRLVRLILFLQEFLGSKPVGSTLCLNVPLKQSDIATMIGSRAETVSRAAKELERDRCARISGRQIEILSLDRLRAQLP